MADSAGLAWANILDGSRETLVLLGIIVLQTDLEFHGLAELPLLGLCRRQHGINTLVQSVPRHFPEMKTNSL